MKLNPLIKRYGVIDLGTNSFHLLIVETDLEGSFKEIFQKEIFVRLAQNGIQTIGSKPYQHGLEVIQSYHQILQQYKVQQIRAVGTSALRTASNGLHFINEVKTKTGIDIELISGDKEAQLIYKGVQQTLDFLDEKILIMDIGGGSVEFIIANVDKLLWVHSFPIGAAVLYRKFHLHEPIHQNDLKQLTSHLDQHLNPLFKALEKYPVQQLVGAAGTFEVIKSFLKEAPLNPNYCKIPIDQFNSFYQLFLNKNLAERLAVKKLNTARATSIVVALFLVHFVLQKTKIQHLSSSAYSMKEGLILEMLSNTEG